MKLTILLMLAVCWSSIAIAQAPTKADVRTYYNHQYNKPASKGQSEVEVFYKSIRIYPSEKITDKHEVKELPLGTPITKVRVHLRLLSHPPGAPGSTSSDGWYFLSWFYKNGQGKWEVSQISREIEPELN